MLSDVLDRCLKEVQEKQKQAEKPVVAHAPAPVVPQAQTGPNAPTDKQLNFFHALVKGKQLTDEQRTRLNASLPSLDKRAITTTIQWLIGLPWQPRTWIPRSTPKPNLPTNLKSRIGQGYYAIVDPQDSILKFYQVRAPKEGKWAGWVFLSQVSGENHIPMRDKQERERIFIEIAKDPLEALKRYGKEIGRCGHCRKQLTDEVSREFGIGPVCRKDMGI